MVKQLDWKTVDAKARRMSVFELQHAIQDCIACVQLDVDSDYYRDEASVYRQELLRREGGK